MMSPGSDSKDESSVEGPLVSSSSARSGWQLIGGENEDDRKEEVLTGLCYGSLLVLGATCSGAMQEVGVTSATVACWKHGICRALFVIHNV
jgi:hypothetical protein